MLGRQIWYHEESDSREDIKFSAESNPNAGDKVFRSIMLNNWCETFVYSLFY